MDEQSALYVLQNVIQHFVSIVTEEAKTLPDEDGMWKCGKGEDGGRRVGVREGGWEGGREGGEGEGGGGRVEGEGGSEGRNGGGWE